jgi:hypothetical protein
LASVAVALLFLPGLGRADDQAQPITVPFETLKTQHMVVQIKINGKGPFRMIFDTGAPVTLLTNKAAKEAGVFPKDFKKPFLALFGSMGQFKIKTMQLGAVTAQDLPTIVMDHPTVALMSKAVGPLEGIVGFSFFGRYRMTIDYQAKQMTFVPTNFKPPDMMDKMMKIMLGPSTKKIVAAAGQWGFRVRKQAEDTEAGVTVHEVLADSPAAKGGLQAGDRLLTLAGRWTDSVSDCHAAAARVRPGTEARLVVRRQGKEMELTVKVANGL